MSMSLMKKVIMSIIRAMLKKGESFSQVWTSKMGFPCWFSSLESRPSSFSLKACELAEILEPDGDLADLLVLHPQEFPGVVDVDVAVPSAGAGGALQNARHGELLAVDRAVLCWWPR